MPYVSGYFRRAPGGSTADPQAGMRMPSVAIYNAATGATLLRNAHLESVDGLSFSTGLPGGFLEASFTLRSPAPKIWPVDTGQKVVIRLGNQVVWWGWVEDVRRLQRGRTEELGLLCLGPYQNLQQRKAESWTANAETAEGLKAALLQYCDRISSDYSHIDATAVTAAAQTQTMYSIARIAEDVCNAGNSSSQKMLFAIWEPGLALEVVSPTNLVPNGSFETGSGTDATGWTESAPTDRSTSLAHEGSYGMKVSYADLGAVDSADFITTPAGKSYSLGVWHAKSQETAGTGGLTQIVITWYNSGGSSVGTTTFEDVTDYALTTTAWQQVLKRITAPAGAAKCKFRFYISRAEVGALGDAAIDDVTLYAEAESGTEAKPVAWLWARDLTAHDYLIHTARLAGGMDVTESTRLIANTVWAQYGSVYTTEAEDATSQAAYRPRDYVLDAGDVDATSAAAARDTYLATYKDPRNEPGSVTLAKAGAITTDHGRVVQLPLIRAGDRLEIADGPYAGTVVLVSGTSWSADGLQITPERPDDVPKLLSQI